MIKRVFVALAALMLIACSISVSAEGQSKTGLPPYVYTGDDPMIGAVANYIAENTPEYYDRSKTTVAIPAPLILKIAMIDDSHADVYGAFWRERYVQEGTILLSVSGGESAGIMHLETTDEGWSVISIEIAGDGTDYSKDIIRFCNGDKELEKAYYSSADIHEELIQSIRTRFIREYTEANQLEITAYQDVNWEPVLLTE